MVAAALLRAARQQGRRRLLAWGPAAAAADAQQQLLAGTGLPPMQPCSGVASCSHSAHAVPRGSLGTGFAAAWIVSAPSVAAPPGAWQQLQARPYSLRGGFKRRRKDEMPDRNLPARNEQIRVPQVRVLFEADGEKPPEVMPTAQALKLARQLELDLVMVSPGADPPVARLVEWSKVLYEQQKRDKAALKARLARQRAAEAREVRIGCQIAEHDLAVKMAQARRFLEEGSPLRLVVTFKGGRQIALGREVALYLIGQLAELGSVKDEKHLQRPQMNQWAVMLVPHAPAADAPRAKKPAAAPQQQPHGLQAGERAAEAAGSESPAQHAAQ